MIGAVSSLVDIGHLRNPFIKYRLITIYPVTFYEFLLIKRYLEKEFPKLGSTSFSSGVNLSNRHFRARSHMKDWTEDFVIEFTGPHIKYSDWIEGYLPLKKNRFSITKISDLMDYYNKGRYWNFISIYYLPQKDGDVADIMLGFLKEFNMVLVNRSTLTDIITATKDNLIKYLRHNVTYDRRKEF